MMRLTFTSLRFRLICYFSLFALSLASIYAFILWGTMMLSEDEIYADQVNRELKTQLAYFQKHQTLNKNPPRDIYVIRGKQIKNHFSAPQLIELSIGTHEINHQDYRSLHIAIAELPGLKERIYVLTDVGDIDSSEFVQTFYLLVLSTTLGVIILGLICGRFLGIRIVKPMEELEKRIKKLSEANSNPELHHCEEIPSFGELQSFGQDEVGRLAMAFACANERNQQFLQREKRFTHDVSHELRTPIAIIQGALEVLLIQPHNAHAMARIERANKEMAELIETFLILGREQHNNNKQTSFPASPIIRSVMSKLQKTHIGFSLPTNLYIEGELQLNAMPQVFSVLVRNILDNAYRHTLTGKIDITLTNNSITITDTGEGIPTEIQHQFGQAYISGASDIGLGLSIVQRICNQYGWQVNIVSRLGQGTSICVSIKELR